MGYARVDQPFDLDALLAELADQPAPDFSWLQDLPANPFEGIDLDFDMSSLPEKE